MKSSVSISKTILISSSFVGNHRLGEVGLKKLFNDLGRLEKIKDEKEYDQKRIETRIASNKFHEFISFLVENNPKYNFIVRPHPAENSKNWVLLSEKFNNLKVQKPNNPIIDNFKNVSALIHSGCSTAFEAHAFGLSTFYYEASDSHNISKKISVLIDENSKLSSLLNSKNVGLDKLEEFSILNSSKNTLDALTKISLNNTSNFILRLKSILFYYYKILIERKSNKETHKFPNKNKKLLLSYIKSKEFELGDSKLTFISNKIIKIK